MILAGIDMGIETTKAVILKDGRIIGRAVVPTGGIDRPDQARKAYDAALADAGVTEAEVEAVSATGKGKYDVPFAGRRVTETIAAAHAGRFLYPGLSAVMSVGADEVLMATMGEKRPVGEFVLNQKCAAGLGTFLSVVARRLDWPIERMGEVETDGAPAINENCTVFGELDALSLLNDGVAPEKVAGACVKAAAVRAAAAVEDLTAPVGGCVVLIGGLTGNRAFVRCLEETLGFGFVVPEGAEFAGAVGAALSGVKGIGM